MTKKTLIAAALTSLVLVACGGSDDPPPVTSQVPASASESIDGFVAYLKALVASDAESLEPVDLSETTPPSDDMSPPTTLD